MKIKHTTLFIVGLLILAGLTVFLIKLFNRNNSSFRDSTYHQPAAPIPNSIPRALPLHAPPASQKTAISRPAPTITANLNVSDMVFYDDRLSFEDNLKRLKEFCHSHEGDQRLEQLLRPLISVLLEKASQQFAVVKSSLDDLDGPAAYRNILLGCLMATDGHSAEKANIVWRIALDSHEQVEVRRTASFLTGQVEDNQKRPADLYTLLTDSDSQVVLFALENSPRHLDQRDYDLIHTNLMNLSDVHLQIAAINAIGNAHFPDAQATLANILGTVQTTKNDAFSEPSLLKRAAITYLDMRNPEILQAIKRIALDDNEDPGVRAKAIAKFTPSQFSGADNFLTELLNKFDVDNSLPLRATIDVLLTDPTPAHVQSIRQKLAQLSDPQLRDLLLKRVDVATGGKQ